MVSFTKSGAIVPLFFYPADRPDNNHSRKRLLSCTTRNPVEEDCVFTSMKKLFTSSVVKYILAWTGLPFIAVLNGVLREETFTALAGNRLAHQFSSVLLAMLIGLYVTILNTRIRLATTGEALLAGLSWLLLTIGFEFSLGYLTGVPLDVMLNDHHVTAGNLRVLVLLSVLLSPVLLRRQDIMREST